MISALPGATDEVSLDAKVAFLRQPGSFPDATDQVEAVETHMSWVFLTSRYAYKLKKPVRYEFLDFRSLDSRRHFCEEELRLNRRLSADVYCGLQALSVDAQGMLHLNQPQASAVVEWLIKMRRLAAHSMLDFRLRQHTVSPLDMDRVASRMAAFYRQCVPAMVDSTAYRGAFRHGIVQSEQELSRPAYHLPAASVSRICRAQLAVLSQHPGWFDARVAAGKIVEGHGDLRPEHVCLETGLPIIDCLEFSRDLRIVDPADEMGFLALECQRLGAPALGARLLQVYRSLSGDDPPAALVHFYQAYRAILRARIAIRHLEEEKFRHSPVWRQRALDYLALAEHHQDAISSTRDSPA